MKKSITALQKWAQMAILIVLFSTLGLSCTQKLDPPTPLTLKVWMVDETPEYFTKITQSYKQQFPHVSFEFRVFEKEEYEEELIKAWAKGEGPDIFVTSNDRLGKFREFITPMPENVALRRAYQKRAFAKVETIVEPVNRTLPTPKQLRDLFVDVVASDVVTNGKTYGLPLEMDTLALYYNRTLLGKSQVAVPPTNWEEFRDQVQAIVVYDQEHNVILPATALGTAGNIPYFFDILSVLMMQNGTPIVDEQKNVVFANETEANGVKRSPGKEALGFYTTFSNPEFRTYTWDDTQLDAFETFTQGNLAFVFGYYRDLATITKRAPNLNFSYTKIPQIDPANPTNYAHYNVMTVALASKNADYAWDFLSFATTNTDAARNYMEAAHNIPALRTLVGEIQSDSERGIFAQQTLTATSWFHGTKPDDAADAAAELINQMIIKTTGVDELLGIAAAKIRLSIQ